MSYEQTTHNDSLTSLADSLEGNQGAGIVDTRESWGRSSQRVRAFTLGSTGNLLRHPRDRSQEDATASICATDSKARWLSGEVIYVRYRSEKFGREASDDLKLVASSSPDAADLVAVQLALLIVHVICRSGQPRRFPA